MGTLVVEGLCNVNDVMALVHYLVDDIASGRADEIYGEATLTLRRTAVPTLLECEGGALAPVPDAAVAPAGSDSSTSTGVEPA